MSATVEVYQILTRGLQSDLANTDIEDGRLRFTSDAGRLYLDIKNDTESKRVRISDTDDSYTEAQILAITSALPKIYLSSDTHRAFVHSGTKWIDLAVVKLSLADIADLDLPIWFSASDAEQPSYGSDFTYNTSTKTLKVNTANVTTMKINGMIVTNTVGADGSNSVEFSFA